jgi:hypothetical protein
MKTVTLRLLEGSGGGGKGEEVPRGGSAGEVHSIEG